MSSEIITALSASAVSIITAVATYIISRLKTKSLASELEQVKKTLQDSDKLYYIQCPNCKAKIYLDQVSIKAEDKTQL
jgi:predicted Zn-ribbon and HTH transcriptional regulator